MSEKPDSIVINVPQPSSPNPLASPAGGNRTTLPKPMTLSWENVRYTVTVGSGKKAQQKVLLQGVSGIAKPGQVIAIMGASGAGKSTLLNVLAGRVGPGVIEGKILVNGELRSPKSWKSMMAYVEQDDLMYEQVTVRETFDFAAQMRLPRTLTSQQKKERVDKVIAELGLLKCENNRIGSPEKRGISGGERKRVSIGIELVSDPHLLFLDEPTSGLDAFTAASIVDSIKNIAVQNQCTVLMTIHQPREYILGQFDKIFLLSEGKVIYFGDVSGAVKHFEASGFPCPANTNPSDFFLDTMTIDYRSPELKALSLERVKKLQESWNQDDQQLEEVKPSSSMQGSAPVASKVNEFNNSFIFELMLLIKRNLVDALRNPAIIGSSIGQAVINTLIFGFVFFQMDLSYAGIQNRIGSLFMVCINQTFGNVMPTLAIFTLQREIIKRERSSGTYRASSAYFAKVIAQLPITIVACLLFVVPLYWMIGLQPHSYQFFTYLAANLVHCVTAMVLGIAISSGVPNVQVGQIFAPLIIVIFLIFGGQVVQVDTVPVAIRWIKYLSLIRYTYSALASNELTGLRFTCPPNGDPTCKFLSGEDTLSQFSLNELGPWYDVLVNGCICIGFLAIGFALFQWRSKPLLRLTTGRPVAKK